MTKWHLDSNTSSNTGLHYFQFRTAATCKRLCLRLQGCIGVDFDTRVNQISGGCYVYFDEESLSNGHLVLFVEQYRIAIQKCKDSTATIAIVPSTSSSSLSRFSFAQDGKRINLLEERFQRLETIGKTQPRIRNYLPSFY